MALTKAQKAANAAKAAAAAKSNEPAAAAASGPTGPKIEAPAVHATKGTGGVKETARTVCVVLKMPRGLYLQLSQPVPQDVRVVGGGIEKRSQSMRVGEQIRLKPSVLPWGALPNYPIVNGFSITRDIDAEFWRQYYQQNKNFTLITEGLLRAFDDEKEATAYCREFGALKHGLEPLDVSSKEPDPRVERSYSPNLTDIETDTDTKRVA